MGDKSGIQWTEATWNPVTGCTKVSEGCRHCYIERTPPFRMAGMRFEGPAGPGEPGATTGVLLHADRLTQPIRWRRPRMIFVNSLSDLYHPDIPTNFIARVWATMALAPHHTFQVLTKRPARMRALLANGAFSRQVAVLAELPALSWPLPNVWNGVSVENQPATHRIPLLLQTPSAVRFLSCEPLLGPVSLIGDDRGWLRHPGGIDWIIAGGESGPSARPMHPAWLRLLVDQAAAHQVAMFVKQFGAWRYIYEADSWLAEQIAREAGTDPADRHPEVPWRALEPDGSLVDIPTPNSATVARYGGHNSDPTDWPAWARVRQFPGEVVAA